MERGRRKGESREEKREEERGGMRKETRREARGERRGASKREEGRERGREGESLCARVFVIRREQRRVFCDAYCCCCCCSGVCRSGHESDRERLHFRKGNLQQPVLQRCLTLIWENDTGEIHSPIKWPRVTFVLYMSEEGREGTNRMSEV